MVRKSSRDSSSSTSRKSSEDEDDTSKKVLPLLRKKVKVDKERLEGLKTIKCKDSIPIAMEKEKQILSSGNEIVEENVDIQRKDQDSLRLQREKLFQLAKIAQESGS